MTVEVRPVEPAPPAAEAYLLAPAGLLATADPDAAAALLRRHLLPDTPAGA